MADFNKGSPTSSHDKNVIQEKVTPGHNVNGQANDDPYAGFGVNEKALLRKIDLKLLPAVTLLYLLSFLDRSNGTPSPQIMRGLFLLLKEFLVANARVEGLTKDLHMSRKTMLSSLYRSQVDL